MTDLSIKYLGLNLKSPVIVSSSGLTNSLEKITGLEIAGAGAVVLKSLFEEQILFDSSSALQGADYPEAADYINTYVKDNSLVDYLTLIEQSKKATSIPIIASINCISAKEWVSFAKEIEKAGADALELNVFYLPTNAIGSSDKIESLYYTLVEGILKHIKIPLAVKISQQITNLSHFVNELYFRGVKGVVAFNRFYSPDIDLNKVKISTSEIFSNQADLRQTLRWTGILSKTAENMEIAASTGVHDGDAIVKLLLAGANAVQVCSVLYKKGPTYIATLLDDVRKWMDANSYKKISDFRGKLSYKNIPDPALYERTQFMKYYSSRE